MAAQDVAVDVIVDPEIRRRGIFEAPVYAAKVAMTGTFSRPAAALFSPGVESIGWQETRLSVGLRDLNGVASQPLMNWDAQPLDVEPGTGEVPAPSLSARVPRLGAAPADRTMAFDVRLAIHGGRTLMLAPLAKTSRVMMKSAWPSPS